MQYFLFIILLITTSFYGLYFLKNLIPHDVLNFVFSIGLIFLCLIKKKSKYRKYTSLIFFMHLTILSVALSFIVSYIDWGQPVLISIVVSRSILWISLGFFLIRYNVTKTDIIKSLKYFSFLYLFLVSLTKISPTFNFLLLGRDYKEDLFTGSIFSGIEFVVLYYYFIVEKVINKKYNNLIFFTFVLFFISLLLTENRTTIFSSIIILGVSLLMSRKLNLFYKTLTIIIILFLGYYLFKDTLMSLLDETFGQIKDQNYNRNKAFNYFIYNLNDSWYSKILGNGFASTNSSYGLFISKLKEEGIFQSDMGIFGLWTIYGLLIIYGLGKNIYRIIKTPRMPLYLKMQSFHIILGFLMYSFVLSQQIVFFILFFYLAEYEIRSQKKSYFKTSKLSI